MIRILSILITVIFSISCGRYTKEIESALLQSGNNRAELEKVLERYSHNVSDSLKFRAAEFLIANMPGHYSIAGEEIDKYVAQVDSMYPNLSYYMYPSIYLMPYYANKLKESPEKIYDINVIKADFLIKNIDFKFALRETIPWGQEIPFDLFCETILPYRTDIEPLKDIPSDSLSRYISRLNDIFINIPDIKLNTYTLKTVLPYLMYLDKQNVIYSLPAPVFRSYSDCVIAAVDNHCKNSWIGIPSFIDMTPHWASKDNRHYWNIMPEFDNRSSQINEIPYETAAKIYRKTYSHNEYIDDIFNTRFLKDVTNEYLNCRDIKLDIDKNSSNDTIYLCIFNEREWKPVAWSLRKRNRAEFKDIAYNVLYIAATYENESLAPVSDPFYIDMGGNICKIKNDDSAVQKIRLTRKYPVNEKHIRNNNNLFGLVIEASNKPDFTSAEQIDSVNSLVPEPFYSCGVNPEKEYRYWRIRKRGASLSEIRFYDKSESIIKGDYIHDVYNDKNSVEKLFDGLFSTDTYINTWIGMDFGKPVRVSKIEIAPQNDTNYIYPGDVYELLYFNESKWITHEIKEADNYYIEFNDVSTNGLYWLRNITEGKEERPFTLYNGRIRFW